MEKPFVCVSLVGRTAEELSNDASRALEMGADIVEARLDFLWTTEERIRKPADSEEAERDEIEVVINQLQFEEIDFKEALDVISNSIEAPLLLACRSQGQGGYFPGTEDERLGVLKAAISCKPSWIDLEADIPASNRKDLLDILDEDTKTIASLHSVDGTPSSSEIIQEVLDAQELGNMVKACYNTNNRTDSLRIFEAALELKSSEVIFSLMGLGPGGDWTRIHAPMLGQYMAYATTESGWHLAQQGRINASDLRVAWKVLEYQ